MLELCFDGSVGGMLRVAQHCGEAAAGGAVAVAVRGRASLLKCRKAVREVRRQIEERRREAVSLGGSPEDVLTLSLGLDQGDIRSPLAAECPRKALLRRRYEDDEDALERVWRKNLTAMARLRTLGSGDTVRIWAENQPHAACGVLFAAALLAKTEAEIRIMPPPPWRQLDEKTAVQYLGWGELHPEELWRFLDLERPLPPVMVRILAARWRTLQEENAPLRAVINGEVRSVPATFYDGLIRKHLPAGEEKRVAVLIGDVLGRERPGIGDGWLADRIRAMLAAGEAELVQKGRGRQTDWENFYRSTVRKREAP